MSAKTEGTKKTLKTSEVATVSKIKAATSLVETTKSVMYIGPTIKGVVSQNTIFNNGLPSSLEEKKKEIPALYSLVVPIEQLAQARKELKERNSVIGTCYKQVLLYLNEKGGN